MTFGVCGQFLYSPWLILTAATSSLLQPNIATSCHLVFYIAVKLNEGTMACGDLWDCDHKAAPLLIWNGELNRSVCPTCSSFISLSLLVIYPLYPSRFFIFHCLGLIIHFSTSPIQCGFVDFVWIFNVWRWRVHGCSTLLVTGWNPRVLLVLICSVFAFEQCSVQN